MSEEMALRVLVAEDDDQVRNLLKAALNTQGYRAILARDGQEALAAFQSEPAHAVITDLSMPNLDGIGLIEGIRKLPLGSDVPILVLTALDLPEWQERATKSGATQLINKPFRPKDILHCLRTLLENPNLNKSTSPPRREPRRVSLSVRYQTAQGFLNCFARNLMDGRSFIETKNLLPLGSTFTIDISPPGEASTFQVQAVVRWINLYEENRGMGVQFSFVNPDDEQRVQDWINASGQA